MYMLNNNNYKQSLVYLINSINNDNYIHLLYSHIVLKYCTYIVLVQCIHIHTAYAILDRRNLQQIFFFAQLNIVTNIFNIKSLS